MFKGEVELRQVLSAYKDVSDETRPLFFCAVAHCLSIMEHEPIQCPICNISATGAEAKKEMLIHINVTHIHRTFQCDSCGILYNSPFDYQDHMSQHHDHKDKKKSSINIKMMKEQSAMFLPFGGNGFHIHIKHQGLKPDGKLALVLEASVPLYPEPFDFAVNEVFLWPRFYNNYIEFAFPTLKNSQPLILFRGYLSSHPGDSRSLGTFLWFRDIKK